MKKVQCVAEELNFYQASKEWRETKFDIYNSCSFVPGENKKA